MSSSEPSLILDSEIPGGYREVDFSSGTKKPLSYLDRFEARSIGRDPTTIGNVRDETRACDDDINLVRVESQDEMQLCFTGFIVTCSDAKQYIQTKDESLLEKPENRMYYLFCEDSIRWVFDYSKESRGIWFENANGWFKLMNPSKKYKPIYDPFLKKCDLWLNLHDIIVENIDCGYSSIISLLKERNGIEESQVLEHATFILNNCQQVEFGHSRLSSTKFAKEFREKLTAEKEKAEREEKEKLEKIERERLEREEREKLEKIQREKRELELKEQLERESQERLRLLAQEQTTQGIKVKKELPKIKPLNTNLAKRKPQINPLVVPYIERLCTAAREEADQGELSDSGDRDPFFSPCTVCNVCNTHRPELVTCKECGKRQLCSVCFYRLQLDKGVKQDFPQDNVSPFEIYGTQELFVCADCPSKLEKRKKLQQAEENDSQESVELDSVPNTDDEEEEESDSSPPTKKSKKSTSTANERTSSSKKRGRERKEPEKKEDSQHDIPSDKVRTTRRKKLSEAMAIHDIDDRKNKKLASEIEKAILKRPNPEFSNGDHAAAIVKLLKNKHIVSQLLDGSLSVAKLVSLSPSDLQEMSKKKVKK
ncbi:hypothetical protein C9374_003193 [Naegleria lovaniensis]|uniref:RFTS domain-containing protein n=1 Tax=Naegleria lovaniensis TaxID=51637 RepID=A0AA88GUN3_NAELO|nr:uncharacterized protein C9374_003193 [Naegleria lovaniensis]KAG2386044.1 hypothetical protein C9374_003193 [Naegleria lovaniensis]